MLQISNLTKHYADFTLDHINLHLPEGYVMGLIGENGAGKTTLLSCILDTVIKDNGEIVLFKDPQRKDLSRVGVVLDEIAFADTLTPKQIGSIVAQMFRDWDAPQYAALCERYGLAFNKKIKEFSKGMKMKLNIAVALSHHPDMLIMDEATSGLDPVARDELLNLLFEFVQDGRHSILMSSHILSDIEKIADIITFIHQGKIVFSQDKESLLEKYVIVRCDEAQCAVLDHSRILGVRKNYYGIEICIEKEACPDNLKTDKATIEDIMVFTNKGVLK